jgi:phenylpropionate dioxygenase-like ring-hydroxylating dioxygenase large terminal subunit
MNIELQCQLVRRVLAHLEARTTDSDAAMTTVPIEAYADAKRIDRERARLFRDYPVIVGHTSQVPNPGDFFTHDASGVPLIITRGNDHKLHALINVCRHRGTRVESQACGSKAAFVCPYHAWTYGRDGALLGVPHERAFVSKVAPQCNANGTPPNGVVAIRTKEEANAAHDPDNQSFARGSSAKVENRALPREGRGLVEVPIGVAAGLIFVRPTPLREGESRKLDMSQWLGSIGAELDGFGLTTSYVYAPILVERALSWKLGIDVFLETYHLRTTHKDTIYRMFFDNVGLVDPVGPHLRNVFPKRSIRELSGVPDGWILRHHANVLYHLFPNTLVLIEPDHAAVLHLWPVDAGRTMLQAYMLVPEAPVSEKAQVYWDANNEILLDAINEDFSMGESIQRGLASGANRQITFGAFEHALAHFHAQVERLSS